MGGGVGTIGVEGDDAEGGSLIVRDLEGFNVGSEGGRLMVDGSGELDVDGSGELDVDGSGGFDVDDDEE